MLRLDNITKIYGKGKNEFSALKGVSIDFPSKGLVVILGKSGSGKSTLLNIIGGLDKATSGDVIVDGKSTNGFKPSELDSYRNTYVGMVFQEFNLIDEITVAENIAISLRLQESSPEVNAIDDALSAVGLPNMGYRKPTELSGGQRQRVAIARALIKNPEIILADEPTGALDFATGEYIFETLKRIARDKLVIVVTHDRELAFAYGERIIEIVDGGIVSDVTRDGEDGAKKELGKNVIEVSGGGALELSDISARLKKGKANYVGIYRDRDKLAAAYPDMLNADSGESETTRKFTPTKEIDSDCKTDLSLRAGKLKFKDAFTMAAANIKRTKRKFIFLVVFSAIAFVFMAISFILSTLSTAQLVAVTSFDGDIGQVAVRKLTDDGDKSLIALTDGDADKVKDITGSALKYYNNKLSPVYAHKQTSVDRDMSGADGAFGLDYYTGIIVGSPKDIGLKVTGRDRCTTADEIIISDLAAFELVRSGFVGYTADGEYGLPQVSSQNDLIGASVKIYQTGASYKIVGIFDTDYEKYSSITSMSSLDSGAEKLKTEFIQNSNFIYSKVFAHASFPEIFASMSGTGLSTASFSLGFENNKSNGARELSRLMFSESAVSDNVTDIGASAYLWNSENIMSIENIKQGETVLSMFDAAKLLGKLDAYYEKRYSDILQDAAFKRLVESPIELTFYDNSGDVYKRMNVRVVGVIDPKYNDPDLSGDRFLLSESDLKTLYTSDSAVNALYIGRGRSENALQSRIKELNEKGYIVTSAAMTAHSVVGITETVSTLANISLYITIAFGVFTLLFMFNYMSQSIKFRTKEIAVYRVIGARGRDLSKMFLIEGAFIAVITTILASVLTALAALLLNELISGIMLSTLSITFGLINFEFYHVPLILVSACVFVGLSLAYPVFNIVRRKPVDSLKMI